MTDSCSLHGERNKEHLCTMIISRIIATLTSLSTIDGRGPCERTAQVHREEEACAEHADKHRHPDGILRGEAGSKCVHLAP